MAMPDLTQFWMLIYGGYGYDSGALTSQWASGASGIVYGSNPPYASTDFAAIYPKFLGTAFSVTGATTAASEEVILSTAAGGLAAGQILTGVGIADLTTITSVSGTNVQLSAPATATAASVPMIAYSPLVPVSVLAAYIALASASLQQARWRSSWQVGMALYIAHLCTLYLQTEGLPGASPMATALTAASVGLGITTSQGVDGVSFSIQPVGDLVKMGSWALTTYGVQLWQMGRVVGMGPIYVV